MSNFVKTMSELGYKLTEQDKDKLTYEKNAKYSTMVLVIDLKAKYINPILVPNSVILYEKDLDEMFIDFRRMRQDAELIMKLSQNTFKVLNSK